MPYIMKNVEKGIEIHGFFSLFEPHYSNDFSFAGEMHDFWEMLFVIDGEIGVSADDRAYTLCKNDIIFHKPMELHKLWSLNATCPHLLTLSFNASGEFLERLEQGVFHLTHEQREKIFALIDYLRKTCGYTPNDAWNDYFDRLENPYEVQMVSNLLENFLLALDDSLTVTLDTLTDRESSVYKSAVQVMDELLFENPSISDIAERCLVSASYLKKLFSKYAGIGVHKYFLRLKLNHAAELLKKGHSVTGVSEILSFNTQNYFSTVFKREFGASPSAYAARFK